MVLQIIEISWKELMNVDMPAEMQCQNTATHQNIVRDAQKPRLVQMNQKMSSEIHKKSREC